MTADQISTRIADLFDCVACVVQHDGEDYIVTDGTGDGAFAYTAAAAERGLDAAEAAADRRDATDIEDRGPSHEPYTAFCDRAEPSVSEALARAVYAQEERVICRPGSCRPVIDEDTLAAEAEEHEDECHRAADENAGLALDAVLEHNRPVEYGHDCPGCGCWIKSSEVRCNDCAGAGLGMI